MSLQLGITDSMYVSLSELRELVLDREAWRASIHGVAKSRKRLSDWSDLIWSDSWANDITQSLFYNNVLKISYNRLNITLKVKNRVVVWVQNGSKWISCLPFSSRGWLGAPAHCCCRTPEERIVPYKTSLKKRSKLKIWSVVSTKCISLLHHREAEKS